MIRFLVQFALAIVVSLGVVFVVQAQDQGSPTPGTEDQALCATPLPESEASPAAVSTATDAAATPDGAGAGTPVGLFPCETPVGEPTAPAEQAAQQTVTMIDIAFDPKDITIAANTDVAINLVNNGVAVHNFVIDELGVNSGDYSPGQTGSVTINAAPGTYTYYCSVPGHKEAGMIGTLTVQ
jgi:plastocyanin